MGSVRSVKGLILLLALAGAGCGSGDHGAPGSPEAPPEQTSSGPTAEVLDFQTGTANTAPGPAPTATGTSDQPTGAVVPLIASAVTSATPSPGAGAGGSPPDPTARAIAIPEPTRDAIAASSPPKLSQLRNASQSSPFHQFGDDVFTWDDRGRIVVLEVPVDHPSLAQIKEIGGHTGGTIADTPGTRAWVQQCARQTADEAIGSPGAVYGAVSAQAVYDCLGGLVHLADLFARYWWTEEGVGCLSDAVTAHSLHGDNRSRPLAVCPSIGYDPASPRAPGWLAKRCAKIAAAHPNPRYPSIAAQPVEPLPSCWAPLLRIIEAHAAESAEIGLPDSPHDCYHAFLGYVWARQTGRESRPPNDLAIGCHYRAFEATP